MKITKVNINISQKINLGNYETRDYHVGLELELSEKDVLQEVIAFGREKCLEETFDYYSKVKEGLSKGPELTKGVDKKYIDLEKKIEASENETQLRTLTAKIEEISDDVMQKTMMKKFNLKLITIIKK